MKKISCEGRQALDRITVKILNNSSFSELRNLALDIENGNGFARDLLSNERYRNLLMRDRKIRPIFQFFTLTSVGFDFRFEITEDNDNMIDLNLRTFPGRDTFTFGIKKGKKLTRKNERRVQKQFTFFGLHLDEFDPINCQDIAARRRHLIYPITGKIGLQEVFETYMKLASGPSRTPGLGAAVFGQKKTANFSDKMTFTTALSSTLTPKIEINPAATATRTGLLNATGTFGNSRTDIHEVTIAVATGKPAKARNLLVALNKGRQSSLLEVGQILQNLRAQDTLSLIRQNNILINALTE